MRARTAVPLLCLALAACRTVSPEPAAAVIPDTPAAAAARHARAEALGLAGGDCAMPHWSLAGRVALSNGRDGGSGQLEWTQGGGRTRMSLSAPITRQHWVLEVGPDGATLHGLPDGPRRGTDAAGLLLQATGWQIPVDALGCWLRAVPAAGAGSGEAVVGSAANLLPARIEQGGWVVVFGAWSPDPASGVLLPSRIDASRGEDRVRLVVDRWGAGLSSAGSE